MLTGNEVVRCRQQRLRLQVGGTSHLQLALDLSEFDAIRTGAEFDGTDDAVSAEDRRIPQDVPAVLHVHADGIEADLRVDALVHHQLGEFAGDGLRREPA